MSGAYLNLNDELKARTGWCPHCGARVFKPGPRERLKQNWLCGVCYREYSMGDIGPIEIVNEICPKERLKEIYGIMVREPKGQSPKSKGEDPFL